MPAADPPAEALPTTPTRSTARRALLVLAAAAAVLALLTAVAMVVLVRHTHLDQALRQADRVATVLANEVVGPALDLDDPGHQQVLDQLLGSRARDGSIVRIKVWSPDGTVLWADDGRLIGMRYQLAPQDQALVGTRDAYANLTDLSKPENAYEQSLSGTFIEVYAGFFDVRGRPLVFEAYQPVGELGTWPQSRELAGLLALWLLLLLGIMLPFSVSLAARVDRAAAERQGLLRKAVEASELERKRLAQDLHDGVMQDLAGVGYAFNALEAQLTDRPEALATARRAGEVVRRDVSALRSLSTDLYPPDLRGDGLQPALEDLLDNVQQHGVTPRLQVDPGLDLSPHTALVAYRVVREAARNVVKHSGAQTMDVTVQQSDGHVRVMVRDDGGGFDAEAAPPEGHLGLRLLRDAVTGAEGHLHLASGRDGTVLSARLPLS